MSVWVPEMEEDLLTLQKKMYKVVKCLKRMEFILKDASEGSGFQAYYLHIGDL